MFKKTIEALKAVEVAAQEELDALWMPYDVATGAGGVHWHAAGSAILTSAIQGVGALRADLEKRQALIDEAAQTPSEVKAKAVADAEAQVAAATGALEAAKALPEGDDATVQKALEEAEETPEEEAGEQERKARTAQAQAAVDAAAAELAAANATDPQDTARILAAESAKVAADAELAAAQQAEVTANV